jgi:hypothetical protein
MTYRVTCPLCGKTYESNLPRDPKAPTFYTGEPWRCLPCRGAA